jgi:catalase
MPGDLPQDILGAFDALFGVHPGFRPVHAKGALCIGTFAPAPAAAQLTRAPHVTRPSTPVIVRFSNSTGLPEIPDGDPNAGPRGLAIRFSLADHVHTDIVAHSTNGFPVRTSEEFLEFLRAVPLSGPTAAKPTPLDIFLSTRPNAVRFLQAPKPVPASFANESFFAATAFRFVNPEGIGRIGRFQIRPQAGANYLSAPEAAAKSPNFLYDELPQRFAQGPIKFDIVVQMAEPSDEVADASVPWPDTRPIVEFGTVTLTALAKDEPDVRKIIFDPIPRVDGIEATVDPLSELRADIYLLSGRRRRAAGAK